VNSKVVYLVLAVLAGEDGYELERIKFNTILTCDEIFEATIKFKQLDGRILPTYKNRVAFAHYCLDDKGDYYLGYGQS
jgi:hypothetical protein